MEPAFDDRGVTSIVSGAFDMKANLVRITDDVRAIRLLLEDEDEEEGEQDNGGPGRGENPDAATA